MTDADGFACLRVWANDAFTYKVSRNGVIYWDYTVRFEILNKDGVCVVVNPPVVDLLEMDDEIEAQLELAEYFKMQAKLKARIAELDAALVDVTARLVAAVSLLERGGKKAAPSNRMFNQIIVDYKNCIERSRAALKGEQK